MSATVSFCNYTIGTDAYEKVPEICSAFGTRIFIITGEKAWHAASMQLEAVIRCACRTEPTAPSAIADNPLLKIVGIELFGTDCTMQRIHRLAAQAGELHADMIFGVGGGKALDTAKGAASEAGLPVFTFPTIASTCAASSALSVVYREDHSFEKFLYYDRPARHCFIHTQIIADAPDFYLRAGMGDTIGKYFECRFAARRDLLRHSAALGHEISSLCWFPLQTWGARALKDCRNHLASEALEQAILAIIISTGMVSLLVPDEINGAIAHSVYYALCLIPGFEKNYLHGDVVGYGVLVQLAVDHDLQQLEQVRRFLLDLGISTKLSEMDIPLNRKYLSAVLTETINGPDMEHIPYPVDEDMIYQAMELVENI